MTSFGTTLLLCAWMGWGLATSPLPLAALGVMLLNNHPARSALSFTATWFTCQFVAIAVSVPLVHLLLGIQFSANERSVVGYVGVILGSLMAIAAVILWSRSRHNQSTSGADKSAAFLNRASTATPRQAAQLGFIFGLLNVTNIAYWLAAALFIHRGQLDLFEQATAVLVTALVASSTFIVISLLALIFRRQLTPWLNRGRSFVLKHSGSIVPGILLAAGLTLVAIGTKDLGVWS